MVDVLHSVAEALKGLLSWKSSKGFLLPSSFHLKDGGAVQLLFPSPLDRIRSNRRDRGGQLGVSLHKDGGLDRGRSYSQKPLLLKEPFAPANSSNSSVKTCTMDKFQGDALNTFSFSPGHTRGSFAKTPDSTSRSVSFSESWASFSLVNSSSGGSVNIHNPNKAVITIDAKSSEILVANDMACRLFGYNSEELCQRRLADLFQHKRTQKAMVETHLESSGQLVLVSGKVVDIVDADGEAVPVSLWMKRLETGRESRCLAVMEPVERTTAAFTFDSNGTILGCDKTMAILHGYTTISEVEGLNINTLIPSFVLPKASYATGLPKHVKKQQATGRTKDGANFPVSILIEQSERTECWRLHRGQGKSVDSVGSTDYLFKHLVVDKTETANVCNNSSMECEAPSSITSSFLSNKIGSDFFDCNDSRSDLDLSDGWGSEWAHEEVTVYSGVVWVFANISGMVTILPDGTIHSCNHYFALMLLGYTQSQLVGKNISFLIPTFYDDLEFLESDSVPLPAYEDDIVEYSPNGKDSSTLEMNFWKEKQCSSHQYEGEVNFDERLASSSEVYITEELQRLLLRDKNTFVDADSPLQVLDTSEYCTSVETEDPIDIVETIDGAAVVNEKCSDKKVSSCDLNGNCPGCDEHVYDESSKECGSATAAENAFLLNIMTTFDESPVQGRTSQLTDSAYSGSGDNMSVSKRGGGSGGTFLKEEEEEVAAARDPVTDGHYHHHHQSCAYDDLLLLSNRRSSNCHSHQRSLPNTFLSGSPKGTVAQNLVRSRSSLCLSGGVNGQWKNLESTPTWPGTTANDVSLGSCSSNAITSDSVGSRGTSSHIKYQKVDDGLAVTTKPSSRFLHLPKPQVNDSGNQSIIEGSYFGVGRHRDGSDLGIIYQIKRVNLDDGQVLYCLWVSRDPEEPAEGGRTAGSLTLASSVNSTLDASASSVSLGQIINDKAHVAETVDHSDAEYTSGPYADRYTTLQQIGKGAFGCVKMAFRNTDKLLVITKFIRKAKVYDECWVDDNVLKKTVPLEVSLLTTLKHPNIVQVFDVFENADYFQMVMEKHGCGMDLFEFIDRGPNLDEPLASFIFRQVVSAVGYLHSLNILHRDIKDENIILDERFHIKLIDFGSATFMAPGKLFSTFCGTVEYCSPEVLQGNKYHGPELEMWSLGVTLYTLIFGENPFFDVDETIKAVLRPPFQASKDLMALIGGLLNSDPTLRFTLRELETNAWLHQCVDMDNYHFEHIINCSLEEASPPKYNCDLETRSGSAAVDSFRSHDSFSFDKMHPEAFDACADPLAESGEELYREYDSFA